jgi:hypothetical protein
LHPKKISRGMFKELFGRDLPRYLGGADERRSRGPGGRGGGYRPYHSSRERDYHSSDRDSDRGRDRDRDRDYDRHSSSSRHRSSHRDRDRDRGDKSSEDDSHYSHSRSHSRNRDHRSGSREPLGHGRDRDASPVLDPVAIAREALVASGIGQR